MTFARCFTAGLLILVAMTSSNAEELKLTAHDGKIVFATFSKASAGNDKIVLLFHQARSNRHEYDPIVPPINQAGFDTLAIDQRSGGSMWGKENQTVKVAGKSTDYVRAFADLQAAVDWAVAKNYKTIVTVGSSYSAALNFFLAKRNSDKITAMASFSPGEYLSGKWRVAKAANGLQMPVYVTSGADAKELQRVDDILKHAKVKQLTRHKPTAGVHGASTLRKDRNSKGYQANLTHFLTFLKSLK